MKDENIVRYTSEEIDKQLAEGKGKTDWKRVNAMTEEEINADALSDPDAQPTDYEFWENAQVVTPDMRAKKQLTIRVDMDTYEWFKAKGKGYQTLMNNVLKGYVEAQKHQDKDAHS